MADKEVVVSLDPISGQLVVGPSVKKDSQDKISWRNETGVDGVIIEFVDGPLVQDKIGPIPKGKPDGAKVKQGKGAGSYKYTVKLGSKVLDPNVIVEN